LHALWYSPVQISLALYFLFRLLGPSSLGGVAVMLCMIPVTKTVAQWMGGMQKRLMKARDERVELNSEVLAGMKVIKFQAWEEAFEKRIVDLRAKELRRLLQYFFATVTSRILWNFTPLLVALATFAAYVWSGHQLDVASALTALALFDILRFPLAMLPQVINNTVEASVSLNRIRSFLMCAEHSGPADRDGVGGGAAADGAGCSVSLESVTAAYGSRGSVIAAAKGVAKIDPRVAEKEWEVSLLRSQLREAERKIRELSGQSSLSFAEEEQATGDAGVSAPLCLKRVDLECHPGDLVAVVGGVGSGKSSVLAAILGEVRNVAGNVDVTGTLAYHSQIPFIMNATVRDNILFGHVDEPVDEDMYRRALDASALRHDLDLLPNGDMTEIGEKGVTLSGGMPSPRDLGRESISWRACACFCPITV
jgi:ATP-binding cassette subfamily C (CFTR/MRP) protein 1